MAGTKVLLVSALDRFGMAEAFVEARSDVIFGDLIFALGLPVPIRSLRGLHVLAALALPIVRRLSITRLYPVVIDDRVRPKRTRFFDSAEIVAGDFHYVRQHMPPRMDAKIIITNTTTAADVALLRDRGVRTLITTTPDLAGRSFGTNVIEAALIALSGKRSEEMQPGDYLDLLHQLAWQPRVVALAEAVATAAPRDETRDGGRADDGQDHDHPMPSRTD